MRVCAAVDCGAVGVSRGYCIKHYTRLRRYGDMTCHKLPNGTAIQWLKDHLEHDDDACLIWPFAKMRNGYGIISHRGRSQIASRIMCEMKHGLPLSDGLEAAHSCGNGHEGCVHPNHIRWATPSENNQDKIEHGTSMRGEKSPVSKLKVADVIEIKRLLGSVSQRRLAKKFGVSQGCISEISTGANWGWLE